MGLFSKVTDVFKGVGDAFSPISPLLGIGTGLLGSFMSASGQKDANEATIASAREQMQFQERMAKNAHQYEVEDLRKAGLNPILSSKYGGASTPSGAMAVSQNPNANFGSNLPSSAKGSMEMAYNKALINRTNAEAENVQIEKEVLKANAVSARVHAAVSAEMAQAWSRRAGVGRWFQTGKDILGLVGEGASSARDIGIGIRGVKF